MTTEKRKRKGKHPDKVLTATRVRALRDPGRYIDGNGLYLVVDPSGAKRWMLRTVIQGKRCDMGLGGVAVVSLAKAREDASHLRVIARAGGDPLADRRKERQVVPTFEGAARRVHEEQSKSFRNEKHAKQWITSLEKYVFPVFRNRRVDQIESADVLKVLSPIWSEIPETASRVKQRMKTVFDWAKASGLRTGDNPTEGITKVLPKHPKGEREHFSALPYSQVPEFIAELREYEGISARLAFEFLILTAGRTSEVLYSNWTEMNIEGKTWTIPGTRMKAKVEHKVPLSARCIEILEAAKEISDGGDYVFPGPREHQPFSNMALHTVLDGLKRKFHDAQGREITPHGFRSSFRDWAEEKTHFSRSVTEAALAHLVKDKVEAAYRRTDLFERRRKLMDAWAAFVNTVGAVKVVKIRA